MHVGGVANILSSECCPARQKYKVGGSQQRSVSVVTNAVVPCIARYGDSPEREQVGYVLR